MKCKDCKYCHELGRAAFTCKNWGYGRKVYYCIHPVVLQMKDEYGMQINNFVGYGESNSKESPLQLKSAKRWCPLKEKKDNE